MEKIIDHHVTLTSFKRTTKQAELSKIWENKEKYENDMHKQLGDKMKETNFSRQKGVPPFPQDFNQDFRLFSWKIQVLDC